MNITDLVLFGAAAGGIANLVDPHTQKGFLGPVFLGILGSVIGGILAGLLFNFNEVGSSVNLVSFMLAAVIAVVLIGSSKLFKMKL